MKDKVVLFQDGYARILTNPATDDLIKLMEAGFYYVINPSLDAVKGLSPEFWKFESGMIIPMSEVEQQERSKDLGLFEPFQPIVIEKEVIKEVIVEKFVDREVIKEVEKIVEVPYEVIREVREEVPVEVIKYITEYKDVVHEVEKIVIKEIPVEVEKLVEIEKLVEVPVRVEVKQINVVTPQWAYWLIAGLILQTCYILLQGAISG